MTDNKVDLPQNHNTLRERIGKSLLNNKVSILGSILIVLFIGQILKFTYPDLLFWGIPLALLAIWLISWFKKVGWADIGLSRPESWSKTIRLALVAMVIVQIVRSFRNQLQSPKIPMQCHK